MRKWIFIIIQLPILLLVGFTIASEALKYHERNARKETMGRIKAWAVAWETYFVGMNTYLPQTDKEMVYMIHKEVPFSWGNITPVQLLTMFQTRIPSCEWIKKLDPKDGWGYDLQFAMGESKHGIRSPGRDGIWDKYDYTNQASWFYDCDIVLMNAQFVQWPNQPSSAEQPNFEDEVWGWPLIKAKPPTER